MAVSVAKAGPYYSSGAISFSSLRSNFRAQSRRQSSDGSESFATDTAQIKASQLLRVTSTTNTNPIVPDATENANITTTQSNWQASDFRDSIKFYYVILPSSDEETNFDIDSQSWNSNLDKNINKVAFIDGICGSNAPASRAARFVATAHNLTIDVYGSILGAGGAGGTSSTISGGDGGDALRVVTDGNNVVVNVRSTGKIYGGGGGGEKGTTGDPGSDGKCVETSTQSGCGGAPGCPGGYSQTGTGSGGCCQTYSYCCGLFNCGCVACSQYQQYRYCKKETTVNGGPGGEGGDGRHGRGYDYQTGSLSAIDGSSGGGYGGCGGSWSPQPSNGDDGNPGGKGGNWSKPGGNTTNTGSGGSGGDAIVGSNYSVTGSTGTSNIKGGY